MMKYKTHVFIYDILKSHYAYTDSNKYWLTNDGRTKLKLLQTSKATRVFYLEPQQSHFSSTDRTGMVIFKRRKLKFNQSMVIGHYLTDIIYTFCTIFQAFTI